MFRIVITLFFVLTFNVFSNAQISIMPKAGFSISNAKYVLHYLQTQDGLSVNSRTNLMGGVAVNYDISKLFSVQTELLYIQKGTKATYQDFREHSQYEYKFSYLEIPILAKIQVGNEKLNFFVETGPSLDIILNAKIIRNDLLYPQNSTGTQNYVDKMAKTDLSWQFGGGLGYKIGANQVIANARYGFGFTDVDKTSSANGDTEFRNRTWAFTIGYLVALKRN